MYGGKFTINFFVTHTIQNFFLIWISRQTKKLHSPKTISYLDQSFRFAPPDKQKKRNLGNLTKISHHFLRMEREVVVIPFWKFWTVRAAQPYILCKKSNPAQLDGWYFGNSVGQLMWFCLSSSLGSCQGELLDILTWCQVKPDEIAQCNYLLQNHSWLL